jgi:hypothetical protein
MNKPEEESSALKRTRFYIKHGRQMLLYLSEFYKSLDEMLAGIEKLDKSSGKIMIFFTTKELADALHSNNPEDLETMLLKYGAKKIHNNGTARYELLDILICLNNIFQNILKI